MSEETNIAAEPTSTAESTKADSNPAATQTTVESKPDASAAAKPEPSKDAKVPDGKDSKNDSGKPDSKASDGKNNVDAKFDLKLPKDSLLSPDAVEKITQFAKDSGLSNEQAQKILERQSEQLASFAQGQQEQLKQQVVEWSKAVESDKEIGGEHFKQNVELAKRVIQKFGSDQFKNDLNKTGLGNHPELVRVFVRIAKQMSDDQLYIPGKSGSPKKSAEQVLYGDNEKEK